MPYGLWELYYNYRSVETDLITLLRYIDLKESNYKTTSAEIRKIILTACSLIEIMSNELEKELGKIKRELRESIPSALYKKCLYHKCNLHNLSPILQGIKFEPWLSDTQENGNYKFKWWEAYNSIKHDNPEIATFEECINSVTAAFVLTVFLTSKTKPDLFWNRNDSIKISKSHGYDWEKIYSSLTQLRKQIWPNYK